MNVKRIEKGQSACVAFRTSSKPLILSQTISAQYQSWTCTLLSTLSSRQHFQNRYCQGTVPLGPANDDAYTGSDPSTAESTTGEPTTGLFKLPAQGTIIDALPSVQHVQINDGYPGEEVDTMLVCTVNMEAPDHGAVARTGHSHDDPSLYETRRLHGRGSECRRKSCRSTSGTLMAPSRGHGHVNCGQMLSPTQ